MLLDIFLPLFFGETMIFFFFLFFIIKNGELLQFYSKLTQLVWCRTFGEQNVRMFFHFFQENFLSSAFIFFETKNMSLDYKRLPTSANQLLKKRFQSKQTHVSKNFTKIIFFFFELPDMKLSFHYKKKKREFQTHKK